MSEKLPPNEKLITFNTKIGELTGKQVLVFVSKKRVRIRVEIEDEFFTDDKILSVNDENVICLRTQMLLYRLADKYIKNKFIT